MRNNVPYKENFEVLDLGSERYDNFLVLRDGEILPNYLVSLLVVYARYLYNLQPLTHLFSIKFDLLREHS